MRDYSPLLLILNPLESLQQAEYVMQEIAYSVDRNHRQNPPQPVPEQGKYDNRRPYRDTPATGDKLIKQIAPLHHPTAKPAKKL